MPHAVERKMDSAVGLLAGEQELAVEGLGWADPTVVVERFATAVAPLERDPVFAAAETSVAFGLHRWCSPRSAALNSDLELALANL